MAKVAKGTETQFPTQRRCAEVGVNKSNVTYTKKGIKGKAADGIKTLVPSFVSDL